MKEIIVKLGKDGDLIVEGEGFSGTECRDATKSIRDLLLADEGKETVKPEMFRDGKPRQFIRQDNGNRS